MRLLVTTMLLVLGMAHAAVAENLIVQLQTVSDTYAVAATLEGKESAEARARISGTLEQVLVNRGEWVKKGQVLGVVKDKKLAQQNASLKIQLEAAEKDMERMKRLLPLQAVSQQAVDQSEANAAALRAQLQNTAQNATDGRILAPFDGQFVALKAVSGTVMMPGESMGTVAASPLLLKLALPERQAEHLAVGDAIALTNEQGVGQGDATVSQIYPQVTAGRLTVEATLPQTLQSMPVGARVKAFVAAGVRKAIVVPRAYIAVRGNLSYVRLEKGGDVLVQAGYPQPDGTVEILSGLNVGDVLIKP